jgi:hypothetical protein
MLLVMRSGPKGAGAQMSFARAALEGASLLQTVLAM